MNPVVCPGCGLSTRPGTRYCEGCGIRLSDNTTRYLTAAVHLDPDYCEAALDEFLVEPVRAVPPSPGADSAAVLRDAVAARTRRRFRDFALLFLLLVFVFFHFGLFVVWAGAAIAARVMLGLRDGARYSAAAAATIAAALVVGFVAYAIGTTAVNQVISQAGLGGQFGDTGPGADVVWLVVLTALLFGVVVADAYVVHWLVHTCFRRDRFLSDPVGRRTPAEVTWRTLGSGERKAQLDRIADSDRDAVSQGSAAVVVHRGFEPFIGAGERQESAGVAFSLEPSGDADEPPRPIDVLGLHDQISRALAGLRTSTSLGPGSRLAGLEIGEQVLASSEELVTHLSTDPGGRILPDRGRPPVTTMDLPSARALADEPAEWVRYYRCYRIETWDRDLIPSTYVHIGTDQRNLYLERVHCVLMPIADQFRDIDRPANDVRPFGEAVVSLFLLPATVPRRIRGFFGKQPLPQLADELVPDRYGASQSLREIASDRKHYRRFYQMADAHRYQQIVDGVLERSIEAYLEEHGYSTGEFLRVFQTVNDFRGADISNSAVGPNARTTNVDRNTSRRARASASEAKG